MPASKTSRHAGINTLGKISQHFSWALDQAFKEHGHSHAILLEEDLVPAPGAQQLPVLIHELSSCCFL